jgi:hypothetical protein
MINPTWTGVLHDGSESVRALPEPVTATRRGLKRAWGVVCGVGFLAARGSIYLLVLPFTVLASLTGVALYAVQALAGGDRG